MMKHGWSADNIAFGSGGALLQRVHRDTQKCAFKCCYAVINEKGVSHSAVSKSAILKFTLCNCIAGGIRA